MDLKDDVKTIKNIADSPFTGGNLEGCTGGECERNCKITLNFQLPKLP